MKKLLLAAIAAGLVSASALPLQVTPAEAASLVGMPCKQAAKVKYPNDPKMRHAFKKTCKATWKAAQK
jgi:hypothetical protein